MTLTFPNRSRSYDDIRGGVRFIGYAGMFEVPFFIDADALNELRGSSATEASTLAAFDAARESICEVARKVYSRGRGRPSYLLTHADFQ